MLETKPFSELKETLLSNNTINQGLYQERQVKRGLRNSNGTGVLAGLTSISSVKGLEEQNGEITPIKGKLSYRGINIFDLIGDFSINNRYCFERVVFLLLMGRLPSKKEFNLLIEIMANSRPISNNLLQILLNLKSKNIMNKLQTAISALYAYDKDPENMDPYENFLKSVRIIAKLPVIIAYLYLGNLKKASYVAPKKELSTAENFLYILNQGKKPLKLDAHILDICLVLHAEHGGGNNSSFTTHVVTSSGSDIYSTIAAAVGSLKGPLHGIANQKVMEMIENIKENVTNLKDENKINDYLKQIILKKAFDKTGKIYGLGHAVYTKSDPRAEILKKHAKVLAEEKNMLDELNLYLHIEKTAPKIFQELKQSDKIIAPNVDFFSGIVYSCLAIPKEVFTPVFTLARSTGWSAHRIEEILSGKRIIRPTYGYVPK